VIEKVEFPLFVEALDHNLDDIVQAIRTHKLPEEIKGILGIAGLDQVEAYVWGGRRAFRSQDGLRLLEIRIDGNTSLHEFRPPGGRNSHGAGQLVVENGRRVLKSGGWGDLKIKDLISASMIEFSPSSPPPFDGSGARFSAFAEIR
jgi:hypothetical protein